MDAAVEAPIGVITEQAAGFADVRVGVLDVAGAVGSEVRLDVHAQRLCQTVVNVDQVLSAAVSDVIRLTGCLLIFTISSLVG